MDKVKKESKQQRIERHLKELKSLLKSLPEDRLEQFKKDVLKTKGNPLPKK